MKILWVNSGSGKTISNTRLYGMPPALERMGDQSIVLMGAQGVSGLPAYIKPLPIPFGRLKLYQWLVTLVLPLLCLIHRPQVVLSDWMSARTMRLLLPLRWLGWSKIKLVHDVRTVPVKDDGGKSRQVWADALKFARRHFDGLTTITDPLREEIHQEFGIRPDKIAVWTSGVDIQHFQPREEAKMRRLLGLEDKFVVFYHGSVQVNRGVVELAQSMAYLEDLPQVRLLVVGGGNEWGNLEKVVQEEKLDKVILKPIVPYSQIPRWIACADLCAVPLPDHPWWRVSSPLKLMEYLAMGKPILLTEMQAHRAVIPYDNDAFYVPVCRPQEFAEGIRSAIREKYRFAQMSELGRAKAARELTWERQAKILRNYLKKVVDGSLSLRAGRP